MTTNTRLGAKRLANNNNLNKIMKINENINKRLEINSTEEVLDTRNGSEVVVRRQDLTEVLSRRPDAEAVVESLDTNDIPFETSIDSLDDYFLYNLFTYLGIKEKLSIERVSKRWQTIIRELLAKQSGLGTTWSTDQDFNCLDAKRGHCVTGGDIRDAIPMSNGWMYDITDQKAVNNLEVISRKCPNVKCLHISHAIIDSKSMEKLIDLFPDLECLHLKGNILKSVIDGKDIKIANEEWDDIGSAVGPFITHLFIDPHYEHRMNENQLKNLIQHFSCLEEFRVGSHFDREVIGKFVSFLSPNCKLFYSLGREFSMEALNSLCKTQGQKLTHLSFFTNTIRNAESLAKIGATFNNLVKLKINLSFNELILSSSSPISSLTQLKELSIDLNTFSDIHVDDGLIWCIKDGLPALEVLEISRASLSFRALNAIQWCLPQLKKLILRSVEIQCNCETNEVRDRNDRYTCSVCRDKCWQTIADLRHLRELNVLSFYHRSERPKPFPNELSDKLPYFQCLRVLSIFRFDISSAKLFESLNELMRNTERDDLFVAELKSVVFDWTKKVKTPKVYAIRDDFML